MSSAASDEVQLCSRTRASCVFLFACSIKYSSFSSTLKTVNGAQMVFFCNLPFSCLWSPPPSHPSGWSSPSPNGRTFCSFPLLLSCVSVGLCLCFCLSPSLRASFSLGFSWSSVSSSVSVFVCLRRPFLSPFQDVVWSGWDGLFQPRVPASNVRTMRNVFFRTLATLTFQ